MSDPSRNILSVRARDNGYWEVVVDGHGRYSTQSIDQIISHVAMTLRRRDQERQGTIGRDAKAEHPSGLSETEGAVIASAFSQVNETLKQMRLLADERYEWLSKRVAELEKAAKASGPIRLGNGEWYTLV